MHYSTAVQLTGEYPLAIEFIEIEAIFMVDTAFSNRTLFKKSNLGGNFFHHQMSVSAAEIVSILPHSIKMWYK